MNAFLAGFCCAAIMVALATLPADAKGGGGSADARFKALYTAEWKWREDQFASGEDDVKEIVDHLPKVDPASQQMRLRYWQAVMTELDAIPRARLSAANQVNYDGYKPQIEGLIADWKFRGYEMPANSDSTF